MIGTTRHNAHQYNTLVSEATPYITIVAIHHTLLYLDPCE